MRADRKQTIFFIIILLILSMGIGYAFLTTTLNIDGVSDIDAATYDVHFENIQIDEYSLTGSNVITPATIGADGKSISFHVKLDEPGDFYGFEVDVVNEGTIPVILEDIIVTYNGNDYSFLNDIGGEFLGDSPPDFVWIYLYESSSYGQLELGTRLEPGETKGTGFGTQYSSEVEPSDLPTEDTSTTLTYSFVFSQAESGYYSYSSTGLEYNNFSSFSIPNGLVSFNDPQSAIDSLEANAFIRYVNNNGYFEDLRIGFEKNGRYYFMSADYDSKSYNKKLLSRVLGDSNCSVSGSKYECYTDDYYYVINNSGSIMIAKNTYNYRKCLLNVTESGAWAQCGNFDI